MTTSANGISYYTSDMAGAPSITHAYSTLIAVLDACLVNGFGDHPAAGFSKVYSATNLAVYRTNAVEGNRYYLRVNDGVASSSAIIHGYRSMTGVSTGSGKFPSADAYVFKRSDSGNRPWALFTDGQTIHFYVSPAGSSYSGGFCFGDIISYTNNDTYNVALIASASAGTSAQLNLNVSGTGTMSWLAGGYAQGGSPAEMGRYSHGASPTWFSNSQQLYPAPATGQLMVARVECWEVDNQFRGLLPGLFNPVHTNSAGLTQGALLTDPINFPGRTFFIQTVSNRRAAIDITGPWRDDGSLGISGKVTELLVPGAYQVFLFRQSDMQLIKTTWSDASGNYEFTKLKNQKYVVMAVDHTSPLRFPAAKSDIVPS
jgi:hypothetical protein